MKFDRRVFRLLYRQFLTRFFISDLVAEGSDPRMTFLLVALSFAMPGLILSFYAAGASVPFNRTPLTGMFVTLSFALMGLATALAWDELFPSRLDFQILRPLPISDLTLLAAKSAAVATVVGAFVIIINFFSCTFLPMALLPQGATWGAGWRADAAQAAAAGGAALFSFMLALALQGMVLLLGGTRARRRLGPPLQSLWLVAMLLGLVMAPDALNPRLGWFTVPVRWFTGVEKVVHGGAGLNPNWVADAHIGLQALAITMAAAIFCYVAGYGRQLRELIASEGPLPSQRGGALIRRLARCVTSRPREQAVFRFTAASLIRGRRQRLVLSMWLGGVVAILVADWVGIELTRRSHHEALLTLLLAVPLALAYTLTLGLRHVASIPLQPEANWIFQEADGPGQGERFFAASKFMGLAAGLPIVLMGALVAPLVLGALQALMTAIMTGAAAAALLQLALLGRRDLPFTRAYQPAGASEGTFVRVIAFCVGLDFFAFSLAGDERSWRNRPWHELEVTLALGLIAILFARWRRAAAAEVRPDFSGAMEPLVQSLFTRD